METKKSIVRSAIFKKSGEGKYGPYHIFEVTFDNGDKGDYMSKSNPQTTFKEGSEVEYTIEKKENGNYVNYSIKPIQDKKPFKPGVSNKVHALNGAVLLACHGKINLADVETTANRLLTYLNSSND